MEDGKSGGEDFKAREKEKDGNRFADYFTSQVPKAEVFLYPTKQYSILLLYYYYTTFFFLFLL